ncbi:hypothetical protein BP6252_14099 [Coleophoma cylindrospora]|uniref:Uncharacterized protein n=1 Tax=Coleophoma cylindrospora TaxID=1849047 RepID=A0A3D8Q3X9_9HELO|nr:hypothetical protein BP6252_14099 [Coleophoma cylindrospora]
MSTVFCCSSISLCRPRRLEYEAQFDAFLHWAKIQATPIVSLGDDTRLVSNATYAIRLVRLVNYGPQESIRYFLPASNNFAEATKEDLRSLDFDKVISYKNYRCEKHNKFFEINLYQKTPANPHHWLTHRTQSSREIDLAFRKRDNPFGDKPSRKEGSQSQEHLPLDSSPFPKANISPPRPVHKPERPGLKRTYTAPPLDIVYLKRVLRFLLPTVGRNLYSTSLLSLLSLEWANAELGLGLEFEDFWDAELTSANILTFICDCSVGDMHFDTKVDLAEVEDLIVTTMRYFDSYEKQQMPGQVRLHEIVNRVLEAGYTSYWVTMYGDCVVSVLASGFSEEVLELCQRKNEHEEQDWSNQDTEEIHSVLSGKDKVELVPEIYQATYDSYETYDNNDFNYDYKPMDDFTACDKECGYCGHCGYSSA